MHDIKDKFLIIKETNLSCYICKRNIGEIGEYKHGTRKCIIY